MTEPGVERGTWAADRQLGWLMSLCGVVLIAGRTAGTMTAWDAFATAWNLGGVLVLLIIGGLAVGGRVLPMPVLRAGWMTAPILGAVLFATSFAAYRGPDANAALPWIWTVEPVLVSYLVLWLRPLSAVLFALLSASLPAVSGLIVLGSAPATVSVITPAHLSNLGLVAIFLGAGDHLAPQHGTDRLDDHRRQFGLAHHAGRPGASGLAHQRRPIAAGVGEHRDAERRQRRQVRGRVGAVGQHQIEQDEVEFGGLLQQFGDAGAAGGEVHVGLGVEDAGKAEDHGRVVVHHPDPGSHHGSPRIIAVRCHGEDTPGRTGNPAHREPPRKEGFRHPRRWRPPAGWVGRPGRPAATSPSPLRPARGRHRRTRLGRGPENTPRSRGLP